jgi:hypothetical protein
MDKTRGGVAVGNMSPEGEASDEYEGSDHDDMLKDIAEELCAAIKRDDFESIAAALEAAIAIVQAKNG